MVDAAIAPKPGESVCDNLPAPEIIAQEIVEDLEAALAQFRLIAGDLGAAPEVSDPDTA